MGFLPDRRRQQVPRNPSKDTDATGINVRSDYHVNEVPMDVYTDAVKDSFASYGDAAIITITRLAGEMYDVPIDGFYRWHRRSATDTGGERPAGYGPRELR